MRNECIVFSVVIFACHNTTSGTRSHMTAADHMTQATTYATIAALGGDPNASSPYYWNHPYTPGQGWYPWYYYWDPIAEHERLAVAHKSAVEAVKLEHQAACATIPELSQSLLPFDLHALGSTRIRDGVILQLAPEAGPPDVLLVLLRCHRAWLRLAPRSGYGDDPISIDGVKLVVHGGRREAIEVMLATRDPAALNELERRVKLSVMRAQQRREAAKRTR